MKPATVHARRIGPNLTPDRARVLLRPFNPATEEIARRIVLRVMGLPDEEVTRQRARLLGEFEDRHEHLEELLRAKGVPPPD